MYWLIFTAFKSSIEIAVGPSTKEEFSIMTGKVGCLRVELKYNIHYIN